jgi:glycosyltransferase involved in cell wall biosynthesis
MASVAYDYQIFSMQQYGGVSRYFCEIAARIQSIGWRTCVIAPFHFNRYLGEAELPTLGFYIPGGYPRFRRVFGWANRLAAKPVTAFRKPDLLHKTYYEENSSKPKMPVIVTVYDMIHELFPSYFANGDVTSRRKKASVEAADHVICISYSTARDLTRLLGVPPEKISVTHLACSQIFNTEKPPPDLSLPASTRPYLLYVGERRLYKNFDRLLDAYAASANIVKDFDLLAFGGGAFTRSELEKIEKLHLRANAVRWQSGDDAVLAQCYASAQAFVCPSEYEGFGIPLLESMSSACPVICSAGSSISEIVGPAGEYFDPKSVDSIRAALERVVLNDSRRSALIEAGTKRGKLFSWEKCAHETIATYNAVVS